MTAKIQAVRGMNDILPDMTPYWDFIETTWRNLVKRYAYREIRLPLVEATQLFKRSIGEVTDIVEKEMYTFADRNGDSLSLRPEGTAGCVRAAIEHGLLHNQTQRLWYLGPMFRHERPQKGRYRQFYQFGLEAYGISDPAIDAEMILLSWQFWRELGLENHVRLQLNSLGSPACRARYREILVAYFNQHAAELDEDSQRRLSNNPLRILDSKHPALQALIAQAPILLDHLDAESERQFSQLKSFLVEAGVPFEINPHLVRGLDYYCHSVFEWVTDALGAQGTVCAGGRYDGLIEMLGGKPVPAVGFAAGLERLILLLTQTRSCQFNSDVFLVLIGDAALKEGLVVAEKLRSALPNLIIETNLAGGSFKSQFKRADKSGARWALIIAEEELTKAKVSVKDLRDQKPQQQLTLAEAIHFFKQC